VEENKGEIPRGKGGSYFREEKGRICGGTGREERAVPSFRRGKYISKRPPGGREGKSRGRPKKNWLHHCNHIGGKHHAGGTDSLKLKTEGGEETLLLFLKKGCRDSSRKEKKRSDLRKGKGAQLKSRKVTEGS